MKNQRFIFLIILFLSLIWSCGERVDNPPDRNEFIYLDFYNKKNKTQVPLDSVVIECEGCSESDIISTDLVGRFCVRNTHGKTYKISRPRHDGFHLKLVQTDSLDGLKIYLSPDSEPNEAKRLFLGNLKIDFPKKKPDIKIQKQNNPFDDSISTVEHPYKDSYEGELGNNLEEFTIEYDWGKTWDGFGNNKCIIINFAKIIEDSTEIGVDVMNGVPGTEYICEEYLNKKKHK